MFHIYISLPRETVALANVGSITSECVLVLWQINASCASPVGVRPYIWQLRYVRGRVRRWTDKLNWRKPRESHNKSQQALTVV